MVKADPLRLKRSITPEEISAPEIELDQTSAKFNGIRCPLCQWRPNASSRWICGRCETPEYFFGGCGTVWNTFTTGGLCPGCGHQWRWTSCLFCEGWSLHQDWYARETD